VYGSETAERAGWCVGSLSACRHSGDSDADVQPEHARPRQVGRVAHESHWPNFATIVTTDEHDMLQ
jgi:hypothetical protein